MVAVINDGILTPSLVAPATLYDPTGGLPAVPVVGVKYVALETANGWTQWYSYEWAGVDTWREHIPVVGDIGFLYDTLKYYSFRNTDPAVGWQLLGAVSFEPITNRQYIDASGSPQTVTLPLASSTTAIYIIKKIDTTANGVTIQTTDSDLIEGAATKTLARQYDNITLAPYGSGWYRVGGRTETAIIRHTITAGEVTAGGFSEAFVSCTPAAVSSMSVVVVAIGDGYTYDTSTYSNYSYYMSFDGSNINCTAGATITAGDIVTIEIVWEA